MDEKLKLYRVTVEFETVILAKDEEEAEAAATSTIKENDDSANLISAVEMRSSQDLPPEWTECCLPWPAKQKYVDGKENENKEILKYFEERD